MKRLFSNLLSLILVAAIFCVGYIPPAQGVSLPEVKLPEVKLPEVKLPEVKLPQVAPPVLSGNYNQDTIRVVDSLRTAVDLPDDDAGKAAAQEAAREEINEFISRYRRDNKTASLASFMTMTTALNALAAHYVAYPNRPVPEKLRTRLDQQFKQVEIALKREAA